MLAASQRVAVVQDAGWTDVTEEGKRATGVAVGVGLSCTADVAEAGGLIAKGSPNKCAGAP
jgi:hypothetical protein